MSVLGTGLFSPQIHSPQSLPNVLVTTVRHRSPSTPRPRLCQSQTSGEFLTKPSKPASGEMKEGLATEMTKAHLPPCLQCVVARHRGLCAAAAAAAGQN